MIIDARTAKHPRHGRPFTGTAAVANVLDEMEVGAQIEVEAYIDQHGRNLDKTRLSVMVSKLKGDRCFSVIQSQGNLARIHRHA